MTNSTGYIGSSDTDRPVVLEARAITKRFPGVVANDNVSLRLHQGEILALLGENGAGKSTLMNILYGLYHQDQGDTLVRGKPVQVKSPHEAIELGIGMVHQHFQLVPVMSVAENIMLGTEVTRGGVFLDQQRASDYIRAISQQYGLDVDPAAIIADLPVGAQQRVEIIKALYRNADILILDEPTAVLTPQESDDLFQVMRMLVAQGKSIIFITHKLREVLSIADRIMVLRSGRVVGETYPGAATETSLAAMMVGREVLLRVEKAPPKPGPVVLDVHHLRVLDDRQHSAVDDIDLSVRAGEILGIAGVQGNGQTELVAALTGLRAVAGGSIAIGGRDVTGATPRILGELGMAHIPEDRQREGLVKTYPLSDNAVLELYYQKPFAQGIIEALVERTRQAVSQLRSQMAALWAWLQQHWRYSWRIVSNSHAIAAHAQRLIAEYDVRTPSIRVPASALSGGNQQKLIVAREFTRPVSLLIAAQPTRGVDVGSIEFIHKQIIRKRDEGCAVLVVSAELDEIIALSDRIAVMYRGKVVATLDTDQASREALGLLMAGCDLESCRHLLHNADSTAEPTAQEEP
jgi:simple sugar transport system ATP-binding protein